MVDGIISLSDASKATGISKENIKKLIQAKVVNRSFDRIRNHIPGLNQNEIYLFEHDVNKLKEFSKTPGILEKFIKFGPAVSMSSIDGLILENSPEFIDYLFFHNVLDKFCWVLKISYLNKDSIKKRKFRLDVLFQEYIKQNKISLKVKNIGSQDIDKSRVAFHLKKGWYNELIRSFPISGDYLNIGIGIYQKKESPGSEGSAPWNVTQSYYSFFEYLSALVCLFDNSTKTDGHLKVGKHFNNHVLGPLKNKLLGYPFTLTSMTSSFPKHPKYLDYGYTAYVREGGGGINELERQIKNSFNVLDEDKTSTIFNLMYQLRIWSNYTGVEGLMSMGDQGYLRFLMSDLATILFFIGGSAELYAIAKLGEFEYIKILLDFNKHCVESHERFSEKKSLLPLFVRYRIFKHLKLVEAPLESFIPNVGDPIKLI